MRAGRIVGGAKQARGWVPTSRASLRRGWECTGSRARRERGVELWRLPELQDPPSGPRGPSGLPAFSGPPGSGCHQSRPLHLLPRRPQAPAGPRQREASVGGLAPFAAAASSSSSNLSSNSRRLLIRQLTANLSNLLSYRHRPLASCYLAGPRRRVSSVTTRPSPVPGASALAPQPTRRGTQRGQMPGVGLAACLGWDLLRIC